MAYLRWLKSKIPQWHDQGVINLAGSGIRSGDAILLKLMAQHRVTFETLLKRDYDSNWGHKQYLEQIRSRYGLNPALGILPAYGASSALSLVFQSMLRDPASERVLVETPAYDPLIQVPQYLGAGVDRLERYASQQYAFDLDALAASISPRTRLVVLTNLHNPSGQSISSDTLRQAGEIVAQVNPQTRILVDETFAGFLGSDYHPAATLGPQFISLSSLTKIYGLGSIRAGWIIASGATFEAIKETWLQMQNIGSRFCESLGSIAFEHAADFETHWQGIVKENRPIVEAKLAAVSSRLELALPAHGCICFPRLKGGDMRTLLDLAESRFKIGLAPGHFFGAEDHFRLGFGGDSATLSEGLDRLVQAIQAS